MQFFFHVLVLISACSASKFEEDDIDAAEFNALLNVLEITKSQPFSESCSPRFDINIDVYARSQASIEQSMPGALIGIICFACESCERGYYWPVTASICTECVVSTHLLLTLAFSRNVDVNDDEM